MLGNKQNLPLYRSNKNSGQFRHNTLAFLDVILKFNIIFAFVNDLRHSRFRMNNVTVVKIIIIQLNIQLKMFTIEVAYTRGQGQNRPTKFSMQAY